MNEPKWAPGPYHFDPDWRCVKTEQGALVALDCGEHEAHLIAAAPELYGALMQYQLLALFVGDGDFDREEWRDTVAKCFDSARAALAKARGES